MGSPQNNLSTFPLHSRCSKLRLGSACPCGLGRSCTNTRRWWKVSSRLILRWSLTETGHPLLPSLPGPWRRRHQVWLWGGSWPRGSTDLGTEKLGSVLIPCVTVSSHPVSLGLGLDSEWGGNLSITRQTRRSGEDNWATWAADLPKEVLAVHSIEEIGSHQV
jgi:hypothetical protein